MVTPVLHYGVAAVTDPGRKRPTNEDAFRFSVEHGVYLVCDGMGGAAAGEIASSVAADEVLRRLCDRHEDLPLAEVIDEAVQAANQAIYTRARQTPEFSGMGTTLVGMAVSGAQVLVFNVGDSRCYRLRNLRLEQISQDHSLVAEQVRMGGMSADEARHSPHRHVITRALGTQGEVAPDLFVSEAEAEDLYLLCSDGLSGELTDPLLESMLAVDLPLDELCARLVAAANQAGGSDNITCLLVRAGSD
ncbi:MAG: Stp1/IreP family PP2C-type Ser/Thr phosphatase [Terracidiphilus sp.]